MGIHVGMWHLFIIHFLCMLSTRVVGGNAAIVKIFILRLRATINSGTEFRLGWPTTNVFRFLSPLHSNCQGFLLLLDSRRCASFLHVEATWCLHHFHSFWEDSRRSMRLGMHEAVAAKLRVETLLVNAAMLRTVYHAEDQQGSHHWHPFSHKCDSLLNIQKSRVKLSRLRTLHSNISDSLFLSVPLLPTLK